MSDKSPDSLQFYSRKLEFTDESENDTWHSAFNTRTLREVLNLFVKQARRKNL